MLHLAQLLLTLTTVGLPLGQDAVSNDVFPGEAWARHESPEAAGYSATKLRAIPPYIIEEMQTTGLMIVVGGRVLGQFGDVEELSYLASCRKSVLAMLYGKYVDDGIIDLDRTLAELEFDDVGGLLPIERRATVRDLITARSGIYHAASNGGDDSADAPERGSQEPGTYFLYNNWDFNAAGAIFEKVTGKDIYRALEEDLAQPIGMQDFDRSAQRKGGNLDRSRHRAYHMWLSTRDMARLGLLMLRRGQWEGKAVLSESWVRSMVTVSTPVGEMNPEEMRSESFGYGFMWWLWDGPDLDPAYEGAYTARGFMGQFITVLPKLDLVVAHKTKSDYRRHTSWSSYQGLLDRIIAARLEPVSAPAAESDDGRH